MYVYILRLFMCLLHAYCAFNVSVSVCARTNEEKHMHRTKDGRKKMGIKLKKETREKKPASEVEKKRRSKNSLSMIYKKNVYT